MTYSSGDNASGKGLGYHATQGALLDRMVARQRVPTALLFHGEAGIGKAAMAHTFSRSLLCAGASTALQPCGSCNSCSLSKAGNHPDLLSADLGDKERWDTAEFRSLLFTLNLRPFVADRRVVLLNNAEELSLPAANALLKSLEEPRPGTHFILVSSTPSRLPRTIVSRCQAIYFSPSLSIAQQESIEECAVDGSAAIKQLIADAPETWEQVKRAVNSSLRGTAAHAVIGARELTAKKDNLTVVIPLLVRYLRALMVREQDSKLKRRLALGVTNSLVVEPLVMSRNLNAAIVITNLLTLLTPQGGNGSPYSNREFLLSNISV